VGDVESCAPPDFQGMETDGVELFDVAPYLSIRNAGGE
jgi:hypothetical protein